MTQFSLANLFGITLRESANDGSDFTNPDADYRRVFIGEDGLIHLKDSAGVVTTPQAGSGAITGSGLTMATSRLLGRTTASTGAVEEITVGTGLSLAAGSLTATGGSGTNLNPGTSFPGSPSNNDLCYRTDRDLLYFYDGTRWLTVTEYEFHLAHLSTAGVTADANANYFFPITGDGTIYLTKMYATTYVTATAIWTVDLYWVASASIAETIISNAISTSGDSINTATRHETDINALVPNGAFMLRITFNETTGSATFTGAVSLRYRRVG